MPWLEAVGLETTPSAPAECVPFWDLQSGPEKGPVGWRPGALHPGACAGTHLQDPPQGWRNRQECAGLLCASPQRWRLPPRCGRLGGRRASRCCLFPLVISDMRPHCQEGAGVCCPALSAWGPLGCL